MVYKAKVSFKPTKKQLGEIQEWLFEEYNSTKDGFYVHWENILDSFKKKQLVTISFGHQTIGFATWRETDTSNLTARIELAEICPLFRNRGFAKTLI